MLESKKEIVRLDPVHTAKVLVLVYLCFSVPIVILALSVFFVREGELPLLTVLNALVFNAVIGFGLLWFACKVYNWVAARLGGITFVIRQIGQ